MSFTGYRVEKVPKNILHAEGAFLSRLSLWADYGKCFPLPKFLHQFQEWGNKKYKFKNPIPRLKILKYLYIKWCSCKSDRLLMTIKSL